jgi:GR25 family glycosyltransferase involved in LPS biosynthesis
MLSLKNNIFIIILSICPILSFAAVVDHLKPALGKEDGVNHGLRNIDFIYMINLDQRPEKFARSAKHLAAYDVYPYRFSAVNGWEIPLETINKLGTQFKVGMRKNLWATTYLPECEGKAHHEIMQIEGRSYFCHCMSRGAIGIVLSHLSILKDAIDSGYKTIWVMEDDVEVIRNPHQMSTLIEKLDALVGKNKWDILFTDRDTKNKHGQYVPCRGYALKPDFDPKHPARFAKVLDVSRDFRRIGARYGAYSMIVRREGMKKILNFINEHKIFLPYDMEFYLPDNIVMYSVREDVVSTFTDALSDNGAPTYKK